MQPAGLAFSVGLLFIKVDLRYARFHNLHVISTEAFCFCLSPGQFIVRFADDVIHRLQARVLQEEVIAELVNPIQVFRENTRRHIIQHSLQQVLRVRQFRPRTLDFAKRARTVNRDGKLFGQRCFHTHVAVVKAVNHIA